MGASRRSMNDQKLNYLVAYLTDGAEYRVSLPYHMVMTLLLIIFLSFQSH